MDVVAIIVFTFLAVFVAVEMALRMADGIPVLAFKNFIISRSDFLTINTNAQYDSSLGWIPKEGIVQRGGPPGTGVTTGRFGIRLNRAVDAPLNVALPEGAILCVGDSFTFGSDVDDEDAWPAILEAMRGEPVVNAGCGGWGTDQIVSRALDLLPVLKPRLVILSFLYDDIIRSTQRTMGGINKPYFTIVDGRLVAHNDPVPLGCGDLADLDPLRRAAGFSYAVVRGLEALGRSDLTRIGRDLTNDVTPEILTGLLVERIKDRLDREGVRLLVVLQFGNACQFEGRRKPFGVATRLLTRLTEMGVPWINTWYVMSDIFNRSPNEFKSLHVMFSDDQYGHLSRVGNTLVATLISEALDGASRPEALTP